MRRLLGAVLLVASAQLALALWLQRDRNAEAAAEAAAPVAVAPSAPEPRPVPARPRRRAPQREVAPAAPAVHVSLDQLLRVPAAPPSGPQSQVPSQASGPSDPAEAATPRRVRVDFSSHRPLQDAPLPREWRRSEASVTVPLDAQDRLRMRSGVRVDEHGVSQTEREIEATPSFGIELRF